MHIELTDQETAALIQELYDIVENDHYPFSPRIRTLRAMLAKLGPEPVRGVELRSSLDHRSTQPLPPPKVYAPPRAKKRRAGR